MKGDHLGEFEELVLLTVHGLHDDAYGATVQARLEEETARGVSIGSVYTALERLEQKGFVKSSMSESSPVPGGRRRRVFVLQAAGARALDQLRRIRSRLYDARPLPLRGKS